MIRLFPRPAIFPLGCPGIVAVLLAGLYAGLSAQSSTQTLVETAGVYVDAFSRAVDGVVLEEKYRQTATGRVTLAREMRSDLAVMADVERGWIEYRDVFEVDNKPVRDRENRVVDLFANPRPDALDQAKRIVAEGARFNLSVPGLQFDRTINLPMAALMFLRSGNQTRSRFTRDMNDTISGRRVTVVLFEERDKPRMIGTSDDAAARGAFWIETQTGRVLRSRLQLDTRRGVTDVTAVVTVDYREVEELDLWLPESMEEHYEFTGSARQQLAVITARALYSNARKYRVNVDERVRE